MLGTTEVKTIKKKKIVLGIGGKGQVSREYGSYAHLLVLVGQGVIEDFEPAKQGTYTRCMITLQSRIWKK